jgi:hypothetical protein
MQLKKALSLDHWSQPANDSLEPLVGVVPREELLIVKSKGLVLDAMNVYDKCFITCYKSVIQFMENVTFSVPDNLDTLGTFRSTLAKLWLKVVRRRGNKDRITWNKFATIIDKKLSKPYRMHPCHSQRLASVSD